MKTRRLGRSVLVLTLAFLVGAPARAEELPAPETVRSQVKTIAVMPLVASRNVPNQAQVQQRIEQALAVRLEDAGIAVIPSTVMRELQDKVRGALGGYYDPRTGNIDEKRAEAFESHTRSEFRRLHPADAWLYPVIETRRAFANGGFVSWDGVQESSVGADSATAGALKAPQVTGSLPALSLHVLLVTPDGNALYSQYGALQLLEYFDEANFAKAMFGTQERLEFVPVDRDSMVADPAREQRAIAIALDPLLLDKAQSEAVKDGNKAAWKQIRPVAKGHRPPQPEAVDRAAFLAKYPRVAVAAPELPDIPNRAAARERYVAAIEAGLARAGFVVVPAAEYASVWNPIYEASGGFFDAMTGELLDEKRKAAIREAFTRFGTEAPIDAVFLPEVVAREANIHQGKARWDGATVELTETKGGALFDKSRAFGGSVPATSLELRAVDAQVSEVFLGRGAIELLVRFKKGGLMSAGGFDEIPPADWLADATRDAKAVERALGALIPPPQ
jgi:hypothetical protein